MAVVSGMVAGILIVDVRDITVKTALGDRSAMDGWPWLQ